MLTGDATSVEPLEDALSAMERPVADDAKRGAGCPFGFTRDRTVVVNQGAAAVQVSLPGCRACRGDVTDQRPLTFLWLGAGTQQMSLPIHFTP